MRTRREAWAVLLVTITAAFALATVAPPAAAHTDLLARSAPADGSVVRTLTEVELEFVDAVQPQLSVFVLTRSAGPSVTLDSPTLPERGPVARLTATTPVADGLYRLGYQIVQTDGHASTGYIQFEVSSDGKSHAEPWPVTPVTEPVGVLSKQRFATDRALPWVLATMAIFLALFTTYVVRVPKHEGPPAVDETGPSDRGD